ncbi:MAG TPA: hypothetical protein VGJ80_06275 [Gemmatimonadales bacterium]|jgi:hypothetical protein
MLLFAVDPGTEQSALLVYDLLTARIRESDTLPNDQVLLQLTGGPCGVLVVEQIESYGMAVGAETFRTVWWAGRFHQAWPGPAYQLPRRAVKLHLCHSVRATDANVRQAILDRFSGGLGKAVAVGTKAQRGPLYGLKGHEYAALAVALTWADTHSELHTHEQG